MRQPSDRVASKNNIYLGASLAYRLINMKNGLMDAWLEYTGRKEPEDLSTKLNVLMGSHTESLNKRYYEMMTGYEFADNDAWRKTWRDKLELETQHPDYPWLLTHPDQWRIDDAGNIVLVDFKHTNERKWSNKEELVDTYSAQMQMQMLVAQAAFGVPVTQSELSVFFGNSKWDVIPIPAEPDTQQSLLSLYRGFYQHVMNDEAPDADWEPKIKIPKVVPHQTRQMHQDNEFCELAAQWVRYKDSYKAFSAIDSQLKGKLKDDDKEIFNDTVRVYRTGGGQRRVKLLEND